jgi:archaellum component FlaC
VFGRGATQVGQLREQITQISADLDQRKKQDEVQGKILEKVSLLLASVRRVHTYVEHVSSAIVLLSRL